MGGVMGDGSNINLKDGKAVTTPLTIQQITQLLIFSIAAITLLIFVSVVYTVWKDRGLGVSLIQQPRTLLLAGLLISAFGHHFFSAFDDRQVNRVQDVNAIIVVASVFSSLFQVSYLWYQWYRSFAIIRATLDSFAIRVFVALIQLTTAMCLIQPIIMIFSIFWYKILISVSAVGIGIMDLFFAFTSLQVLRKETQTISALSNPGNTKGLQYYEIVAKYSVQASVSMMVVLVCFAIQAYFQLESRDLDKTEIIYHCTELGIHSFVLFTLYSLTWMKYALDGLSKMNEKKSRRSSISKAARSLKSSVALVVSALKYPLPEPDRKPSRSIDLVRDVDLTASQNSSLDLIEELAHSRRPASEIPQPKQVKSQQPSCDITSTKSADSMRRACSDNSIRK